MGLNDTIDNSLKGLTNDLISAGANEFDPVLSFNRYVDYKRQHLWLILIDNIYAWTAYSAERPQLSLGNTKLIKYPNTYEKMQQGSGEWQPISFVLNDPIVPSSAEMLYKWIKEQWDYNQAYSAYPSDYKRDIEIRLLEGNGGIAESWLLHEAFLTGIVDFNVSPLNYENNNILRVKFTLDYTYPELFTGSKVS